MKTRVVHSIVLGCFAGVCIALATVGLWKAFAAFATLTWMIDAAGRRDFPDEAPR
jgi:hypothetical protein